MSGFGSALGLLNVWHDRVVPNSRPLRPGGRWEGTLGNREAHGRIGRKYGTSHKRLEGKNAESICLLLKTAGFDWSGALEVILIYIIHVTSRQLIISSSITSCSRRRRCPRRRRRLATTSDYVEALKQVCDRPPRCPAAAGCWHGHRHPPNWRHYSHLHKSCQFLFFCERGCDCCQSCHTTKSVNSGSMFNSQMLHDPALTSLRLHQI